MTKLLKIVTTACFVASGLAFSWRAMAADTPATTQAALPACCGATCKTMTGCCKTDDKGKVTCAMGGSCCVKVDATKPAAGMGGMNMGKL